MGNVSTLSDNVRKAFLVCAEHAKNGDFETAFEISAFIKEIVTMHREEAEELLNSIITKN